MRLPHRFLVASLFTASILPAVASAQRPLLDGLGLEGGLGYSGLAYVAEETQGLPIDVSRTAPYFTPSVRLRYNRPLHRRFHVMPFFGYSAFGGRSGEGDLPDISPEYEDRFHIRALEGGAFALYEVSSFQLGAGLKVNRHLNVTQWARVRTAGPDGPSEPSELTFDFAFLFDDWSLDSGVRAEYEVVPRIVLAAEGWLGFSRLEKDLYAEGLEIRSRHLRLTLSYRL